MTPPPSDPTPPRDREPGPWHDDGIDDDGPDAGLAADVAAFYRRTAPSPLRDRIAALATDSRARDAGLPSPIRPAGPPLTSPVDHHTTHEDAVTTSPIAPPAPIPSAPRVVGRSRPAPAPRGVRRSGPLGLVATVALLLLTVAAGLGAIMALPDRGDRSPTSLPAIASGDATAPAVAANATPATPASNQADSPGPEPVALPSGADVLAATSLDVPLPGLPPEGIATASVTFNRYDLPPGGPLTLRFGGGGQVTAMAYVANGTAEATFPTGSPVSLASSPSAPEFVTLVGSDELSITAGPDGATLYLLYLTTSDGEAAGPSMELQGGGSLSMLGQYGEGTTGTPGATRLFPGAPGSVTVSARLVSLNGLAIESGRQPVLGGETTVTMVTPLDTGVHVSPLRGTTAVSYNLVNLPDPEYDPVTTEPLMLAPGTGATLPPGSRARLDGSTLPVTLLVIEMLP